MDIKKFFLNKKIILLIGIFVILVIGIIILVNSKNDGMKNMKNVNVYYKIYYNDKWSRCSKNGSSNSNKEYPVENIKIKLKSNFEYSFKVYTEKNKWVENYEIKNEKINAIKINLYGSSKKKYSICYRVYNKKDGWLNWSCNNEINGNKNENIESLQIKIIPKNAVKNEYLKDYIDDDVKKSINF